MSGKRRGTLTLIAFAAILAPQGTSQTRTADRIGFVSQRDGDELQLTHSATIHQLPVWSPGGTRLAFMASVGRNAELFTVSVDGTGLRQLTDNPGLDAVPRWSPDGTRILFVSGRPDPEGDQGGIALWVMDADGANQRRLTKNQAYEGWPAWSPDGLKIAFERSAGEDFDLFIINADGSATLRLTNSPGLDHWPVWIPNRR